MYTLLPVDYLINNVPLLSAGFSQIDSCCLNAFMPHQISKHREVVVAFQKAFGKAMAKGMGIYNCRVQTVLFSKMF